MPLTSLPQTFPPVGVTISRPLVVSMQLLENGTNSVMDSFATINGAIRLLKRRVITPIHQGGIYRESVQELEYPANYNTAYNPTNISTALTAPFTLALGTQKGEITFSANQVLVPDIRVLTGEALTT